MRRSRQESRRRPKQFRKLLNAARGVQPKQSQGSDSAVQRALDMQRPEKENRDNTTRLVDDAKPVRLEFVRRQTFFLRYLEGGAGAFAHRDLIAGQLKTNFIVDADRVAMDHVAAGAQQDR